jgi:hypothetical protein
MRGDFVAKKRGAVLRRCEALEQHLVVAIEEIAITVPG